MFFLFALAISVETKDIEKWKEDLQNYREEKRKLVQELVIVSHKIKEARKANEDYSEYSKQLDNLRKKMMELDQQYSEKNRMKFGKDHLEIDRLHKKPSLHTAEDIKNNLPKPKKLARHENLTPEKVKERC